MSRPGAGKLLAVSWSGQETEVKPLPRWTILPSDPEPLRRWLRIRQAEESGAAYDPTLPPEPPDDGQRRAA